MKIRELTCIVCPRGCQLKVELDDAGAVVSVSGNLCKRGNVYAFDECTNLVQAEIEDPASWKADVDLSDPKIAAEWLKTRAEKSKYP